MKGDFSRLTFNRERHYSAVLMQQGRVQVDADWNEQQALTRHRAETEAADVIGRSGGPSGNAAFGVISDPNQLSVDDYKKLQQWCESQGKKLDAQKQLQLNGDFILTAGRYYADGILCESETPVLFTLQPDFTQKPLTKADQYVVYLDVWHRHVTALDDDHIREKALGGPDTASRARVVWQVKAQALSTLQKSADTTGPQPPREPPPGGLINPSDLAPEIFLKAGSAPTTASQSVTPDCHSVCSALQASLTGGTPGTMSARTRPAQKMETPCQLPPSAGYQRLENQLYRVEIHHSGTFKSGAGHAITFKWSRDNGTVVTAITDMAAENNAATITVKDTGPDDVLGFANGQWVEVIDDSTELNGAPGNLLQITKVEGKTIKATGSLKLKFDKTLHPKLRRWDQTSTVTLSNGMAMSGDWQSLEDGVQVQFSEGVYKTGDYWLVPGRTATGDIEWPQMPDNNGKTKPQALPPTGIKHHYCCLAIVTLKAKEIIYALTHKSPVPPSFDAQVSDCRCLFPSLCQLQDAAAELKPAIKVKQVSLAGGDTPLKNGSSLSVSRLLRGIQITCDQPTDKHSIAPATVFVVLDLPFPMVLFAGIAQYRPMLESFKLDAGNSFGSSTRVPLLGYQPLILPGRPQIDKNNPNIISWTVDGGASDDLLSFLASFRTVTSTVLAHLTLKGNFIWGALDPQVYLDGEAFGAPASNGLPNNLRLPSGDGRRGGDFEMWFSLQLQSSKEDQSQLLAGKTVALSKFITEKQAVLKHDFSGGVTKSAFLQKHGSDVLDDGSTVADAMNILPGNPAFSSVEAIPEAVAEYEARSLQGTMGIGPTLNEAFGTSIVAGNISDVGIENLAAIPENVRTNLKDAGISTVGDLASAQPATLKRAAAGLTAKGVGATPGDLAGYAGLAKILTRIQ